MNQHYTGQQPECKTHIYKWNEATTYHEKISSPLGFEKLPFELKLEETWRPEQIKSKIICRSRVKEGKRAFFTGLIPFGNGAVFYGDHYHPQERVKNSFVLFKFSDNNQLMTIYYFNHFKVYPSKRDRFISEFVNRTK